jgi:divalent metal cation (Fe/Co/Zn/Cd) transporter
MGHVHGTPSSASSPAAERSVLLRRGLRLEFLTVGWNVVEGGLAVAFALAAGSVALLGFGIDSFVETASGGIMIWRLVAERRSAAPERVEAIELRARRLVALSLIGLAIFIVVDAGITLVKGEHPEPSTPGVILTSVSIAVMWWLARAKRRTAQALGSRAMEADAFQTTACWWLSLTALVGIALNAALGLWWADPAAAIGMTYFIVREAAEAWRGDDCCDT